MYIYEHLSINRKTCFTIHCDCINSRAKLHCPGFGLSILLINLSVGMQCRPSNGEAESGIPCQWLYVSVICVLAPCVLTLWDTSSSAAVTCCIYKSGVTAATVMLFDRNRSQWIICCSNVWKGKDRSILWDYHGGTTSYSCFLIPSRWAEMSILTFQSSNCLSMHEIRVPSLLNVFWTINPASMLHADYINLHFKGRSFIYDIG